MPIITFHIGIFIFYKIILYKKIRSQGGFIMETFKNLVDGSMVQYGDEVVPKIPVFAGSDITSEVYYFKPNQILKKHRHPSGEQIFFILKGEGRILVGENSFDIQPGSSIFVPSGQWHEIINGTVSDMVAVQVTKVGAGFEAHNG